MLLGVLVPILVLGGIGGLIFFVARGQRGGEPMTSRTLLRAYLRFAYMASLVVFLIGATLTITAGFASAFSRDFSYSRLDTVAICGPGPPPSGAPPDAQRGYLDCTRAQGQGAKDNRQADNLILGISLLVAGLVIGAGHRVGQFVMETPAERTDSSLARTERLVATVGFGLVTIISVPTAAYLVGRYAILGTQATPNSGSPDPPGGALATALVFLVAWGYYLVTFVRQRGGPARAA